tara:strand:+ start:71 stop:526 length:456 start_codon:yes stop_codon:yes gene_type:complete
MITIDELRDKLDNKARLIGLDIGTKHIGIAICDDKRKIATPFKTLDYINMSRLIDDLKIIIDENDIKGMIVGYPINMDGSLGKSAQSVNDKTKIISETIDIYICLWDERLSTSGSFNIESNLDIKFAKRKKNIDEKAASFILQGAIDYLNN